MYTGTHGVAPIEETVVTLTLGPMIGVSWIGDRVGFGTEATYVVRRKINFSPVGDPTMGLGSIEAV
jgi:hypothetical protein